MARLETQINQIYLTHPEAKKNSLILYEEQLTNSLQLFIVAELWNLEKKSESQDLKKISEIILQSFRSNKKLAVETLFETSLSQINQNLADLAHDGHKSWVGKFSCMICIKGADNSIYLANNGQTCAYLLRKSELVEVLPHEKRGTHPLKTFMNFTQGKLTDNDSLILTTANIFNYISFELFSKLINQYPVEEATAEVSKILQDSMSPALAFCAFLLHFTKKPLEEIVLSTAPILEEQPSEPIYAPMPEEIEEAKSFVPAMPAVLSKLPKLPSLRGFKFSKPSLPSLPALPSLPTLNWAWLKKLRFPYFQNLSRAGKFFFLSFAVFLILFVINIALFAGRANSKKAQDKINQLVVQINDDIDQTNSALIYKDQAQAIKMLAKAQDDWNSLSKLDAAMAASLTAKIEQVKTVINKINTVNTPTVFLDLKHNPTFLTNTSIGFLFANHDSNSLSLYKTTLDDYFLLNSLDTPITGITYFPPAGVVVATADKLYNINETLKQFEPLVTISGQTIKKITVANNAIYALSDTQVTKTTYKNGKYTTAVSFSGDFSQARDLGVDTNIYVLFPDKLVRYTKGAPQAFPLPDMTDKLSNATRILDEANLYVFEANKKRLIILNKNTGALINQIYFPSTNAPTDFYVDEGGRLVYLLDDNKLYKITF